MKKIPHYLLPFIVVLCCLSACSDPNALPENIIQSSEGLKIRLEWTTGTTPEAAIQDTDLDLKLMRGTEIVARSENVSRFESAIMHKTLGNGEFRVDVASYQVKKRTDFTLTITDAENIKSRVFTSYFMPGEKTILEFVKIVKDGEQYMINKL